MGPRFPNRSLSVARGVLTYVLPLQSKGDALDEAIAAIAAGQQGLVTRSQLFALGLSRNAISNRITKGRLRTAHPAVYAVAGSPESWEQLLLAALLAAGEGAAISRRAAGRFHSLDGIATERPEIVLIHPRRLSLKGVKIHRSRTLEERDVVRRGDFLVTSPTRTLIDLASVVSHDTLENALDDAVRRRLTTVGRLSERLDRIGGAVVGLGRLRRLVADRTSGRVAGSPLETRLRRNLARSGLPVPVAQYEIRDTSGRLVARVDFAFPEAKLAIEVDGSHHAGRKQWKSDLARQNRLILLGWRFLRFTGQDTEDPRALSAIADALGVSRSHVVGLGLPKTAGRTGRKR